VNHTNSKRMKPATLPAAGAGRRERRKDQVRQRLFRAAVQLFGTRGFDATTVEDITRAADVGKGTFFNYFRTKKMLLSSWAELRLDILRSALIETQQADETVREILRRLFSSLLEEPTRSNATTRCMLLGLLGSEPIEEFVRGTAARARQILAEIMAAGQRRGEIRRDVSAGDLAQLFQQTFFGFMHVWVLLPNRNLSRRRNTTFDLFWAAAAAPQGRGRETAR
jgi:AcrR family transcriptional regulator